MSGIPWDQPGADPVADLNAFIEKAREAPYQPHVPMLSPRCGLEGHIDHDRCQSAICECRCHWETLTAMLEPYRR